MIQYFRTLGDFAPRLIRKIEGAICRNKRERDCRLKGKPSEIAQRLIEPPVRKMLSYYVNATVNNRDFGVTYIAQPGLDRMVVVAFHALAAVLQPWVGLGTKHTRRLGAWDTYQTLRNEIRLWGQNYIPGYQENTVTIVHKGPNRGYDNYAGKVNRRKRGTEDEKLVARADKFLKELGVPGGFKDSGNVLEPTATMGSTEIKRAPMPKWAHDQIMKSLKPKTGLSKEMRDQIMEALATRGSHSTVKLPRDKVYAPLNLEDIEKEEFEPSRAFGLRPTRPYNPDFTDIHTFQPPQDAPVGAEVPDPLLRERRGAPKERLYDLFGYGESKLGAVVNLDAGAVAVPEGLAIVSSSDAFIPLRLQITSPTWNEYHVDDAKAWKAICKGLGPECLRLMDPDAIKVDCPFHENITKALYHMKLRYKEHYEGSAGVKYFRNLLEGYCSLNPTQCNNATVPFPQRGGEEKVYDPNRPVGTESRTIRRYKRSIVATMASAAGQLSGGFFGQLPASQVPSTYGRLGAGLQALGTLSAIGASLYAASAIGTLQADVAAINQDLRTIRTSITKLQGTVDT